MSKRQGNYLPDYEINRIKYLLARTDMTIDEIAQRLERSTSAIHAVNKKFNVREYRGRSKWVVHTATQLKTASGIELEAALQRLK
jgi:hypothetical protein